MMNIKTKRVFDEYHPDDGYRVLVDRLWPRGMTREKVKADLWMKTVAPSTDLRKWFRHDASRWNEFKYRYFRELDANEGAIRQLLEIAEEKRLTLLYSAKDTRHNQAIALKAYLQTISRQE